MSMIFKENEESVITYRTLLIITVQRASTSIRLISEFSGGTVEAEKGMIQ